ncbi:hypothetical protein [Algoriphagus algorifonticola]|uniref:hypothetical protein n=1 Tax=Algoriphagus algorifonticola TaxID=2593007 RepID=UPI00119E327A|nr:hypothetical protein [Algoriphagus algorifonticola]
MKKLLMIFALFLSVSMVYAEPVNKEKEVTELSEEEKAKLEAMKTRFEEIKAMDFSDMTKEEKKEIRAELKEMKEISRRGNGGIFISTGAIIIILLLIIIL